MARVKGTVERTIFFPAPLPEEIIVALLKLPLSEIFRLRRRCREAVTEARGILECMRNTRRKGKRNPIEESYIVPALVYILANLRVRKARRSKRR